MNQFPIEDIKLDANGLAFSFDGKSNLRAENTPLSYSPNHLEEYKKCSEDVVYFVEHYCYIQDADEGLKIPTLYQWQKDLLQQIKDNKKMIVMCSRQVGKSTTLSMFMTWFSLFNNDKTSCVVAQKEKIAKEIFKRVQTSIQMCPQFLKPGMKEWSKTSLEMDNGSRILCAATTADGISGFTINGCLLIDECAKIRPNLFDEFFTAMEPTVSASENSKLVIVSTPKGMNHFYRMWKASEQNRNGFKNFKVGWDATPKRTEEWRKKKIEEIGVDEFNQEYACLSGNSIVTIKTRDGNIKDISLEEVYLLLNS